MADIPVRNSKNGLDCPRCGTSLVNDKAPFYLNGEYIGKFEAIVCDMCHYSLFTPSGYDQAMLEARRYGLVGPPEEIIEETLESSEQEVVFQTIAISSNSDNTDRITSKPGNEKVEINSSSNLTAIPTLSYPYKERRQTKQTRTLIK
ncbi:MAG: hypothetical protein WA667_04700 [Candidatus Nitrosopolaris sp.]